MKIRIKDNSIRLRLTKSEVDQIAHDGHTSAQSNFPGGAKFTYRLCVGTGESPTARFENNAIEIAFPKKQLDHWALTDQVSLNAQCEALTLLVEKDFTCLSERPEEQNGDYYPHPLQKS